MIEVKLKICKRDVYEEVAKTTAYTGAKKVEDEASYDRIFATDADRLMLERFWRESCNAVTDQLKEFITDVRSQPSISTMVDLDCNYEIKLSLSDLFDVTLTDSINSSLFSFFVESIISKWYLITNKEEAEAAATNAVGMLGDAVHKIYNRKKPTRKPYADVQEG